MFDDVFSGYYNSELRFKDEPYSVYDLPYQDDDSIPEECEEIVKDVKN